MLWEVKGQLHYGIFVVAVIAHSQEEALRIARESSAFVVWKPTSLRIEEDPEPIEAGSHVAAAMQV